MQPGRHPVGRIRQTLCFRPPVSPGSGPAQQHPLPLTDFGGKRLHHRRSVNQTYKLKDAQQAHRDLEGRKTTGSTILVP